MARYLERAENQARLIAAQQHLSLMPEYGGSPDIPWLDALAVTGQVGDFVTRMGPVTPVTAASYVILDRENPQSLVNCFKNARDNARTMRHLLTDALWDAINLSWLEAQALDLESVERRGIDDLTLWAISRCQLIRGAALDLLRDELPEILAMAGFAERVDHQARLMTVTLRGPMSDPESEVLPGSPLHRRWEALLASSTLDEAYRRAHTAALDPEKALHLILLHPTSPRSLASGIARVRSAANSVFGSRLSKSFSHALDHVEAHIEDARDSALLTSDLTPYLLELSKRTDVVVACIHAELEEP